ncbi:two-pore potassium channel 1 [Ricinus communis]|uniref:Calcium-activated outward-rectifying potassium channel, putative n=1 Tax=Ricinus communis TaxID=3988 RepID=B9STI3_RICCO|nr:two-pore potassium channel 1 [Ricinus communis]XP_025014914.1 two-pore potassium channel 1 [Ricinus communis]EEF33071.1 Calcium-activated outward-rectifying potassium channel, putative [Ricinus communis]|eukprot:XP_002529302.1 two-pore potassium channel 1 [Ricinus communis]
MACNGAKPSLLSGSLDQTNNAYGPNRRRFLSVKSAPLADLVPKDLGISVSLTPPESIFGKLHPSVMNLAVALAVYLGVGTLSFYTVLDDMKGKKSSPMIDALYFTVVTMTTVGYGDLVPNTTYIKGLSCVFVVIGMALVGLIMGKAADYIVEKQEMLLVKAISKHKKYGPFKIMKEVETYKISYKCLLAMAVLSILMLVGTIFLFTVEDMDFIDSIYCICTTITTLGYGDKAFSTAGGRLFAVIWILTSTIGLGQFFMYVAEVFTESRQRALVNWVLTRGMTNLNPNAADIDNDGVVEVAEFAVHKLKEMGKISQEDISCLMKEFEDLDVQQCGLLSASDLVFAQTKRRS